jgi:hypothetical protein
MKPASNVKTPEQFIASLPAECAKTIPAMRALDQVRNVFMRDWTVSGQAMLLGLHHFFPSIFGDQLDERFVGAPRQGLEVIFTRLPTENQP